MKMQDQIQQKFKTKMADTKQLGERTKEKKIFKKQEVTILLLQ